MLSAVKRMTTRYPITRGMIAYAILWPSACAVQQKTIQKESVDYKRCARYAFYGSFVVAPTLYVWVTIASRLWPAVTFKTAIKKALTEQVTYGPFATCCFFAGMTLLEGGTIKDGIREVRYKFFDTMKISVFYWTVLQTINFTFVPERNRVIFVSICGLIWTTFLAYMKQKKLEAAAKNKDEEKTF